ncbi:(4Fe-4S)-binding protein [Longispora albida]|uniref:(4Fe-4S)-binding protein n=1 Tax=Longispora albida TaxID=203523 RepID=UPI000375BD26|nr:(4Fe-4S)-binding protein [Longispora albida]
MSRKSYPGEQVTVSFDGDLCRHAGRCVAGLPEVFDTGRRPWILPDAAEAGAVIAQVGRCPSGALRIEPRS